MDLVGLAPGQLPLWVVGHDDLSANLHYRVEPGEAPTLMIETALGKVDPPPGRHVAARDAASARRALQQLRYLQAGVYRRSRSADPRPAPPGRDEYEPLARSLGEPPWRSATVRVAEQAVRGWILTEPDGAVFVADRSVNRFAITAYGVELPDLQLVWLTLDPHDPGQVSRLFRASRERPE